MTDALLKIYHNLPAPLRSLAASMRGYELKRWRYGRQTEQRVEEALIRESWPAHEWQAWQQHIMPTLLHRAATRVPYYRQCWSARRRAGDKSCWTEIENWPVLDKEIVRAHPEAFLADDCNVRRMFRDQTSGTSGTPLTVWFEREAVREWYALFEARLRRWNGVTRHDAWAILGGQLVVPAATRKPPFWVWNAPMHQLYLSSYHLSPENAPAYVEALARYQPTHLVGYSSSLTSLSRDILELGLEVKEIKVVLTNAEPLFPWQRALIEKAFQAKVRETYGMAEAVLGASECSAGRLHLWPEAGYLEVLEDDADLPVANGSVGRLVCTGFINDAMPLIRYTVGDRASAQGILPLASGRSPLHTPCPCGRALPALASIEGRTNDIIITPDGRRVYWLNSVFYGLPLAEAQIVQEQPDLLRIKLVPAVNFGDEIPNLLATRIQMRLGEVKVLVEKVTHIPRAANGKFRAVVSQVKDLGGASSREPVTSNRRKFL